MPSTVSEQLISRNGNHYDVVRRSRARTPMYMRDLIDVESDEKAVLEK